MWTADSRHVSGHDVRACGKTLCGREDVSGHDFTGCGKVLVCEALYQGTTSEFAEKLFGRRRCIGDSCDTARQAAMLLTPRLRRTVGAPAFRPGKALKIWALALASADPLKIVAKSKEFRT